MAETRGVTVPPRAEAQPPDLSNVHCVRCGANELIWVRWAICCDRCGAVFPLPHDTVRPTCGGLRWTDHATGVCQSCGGTGQLPEPPLSPPERLRYRRLVDEVVR